MRRERKENRGRVNRKRGIRKTGQIERKIIPNTAHVRTKKKTVFNCFDLGTQGTFFGFNLLSPSLQGISNFNRGA